MTTITQQLQKAQAARIDLTSVLSPGLHKVITANADAIGAPLEFIFYPLLTATASFMGTNAFVNINPEWQEPSILWFIIAARKGEKKTAALKRIRKPIEELETELRLEWQQNTDQSKPSVPPQLIVDYFSFEELHSILARNNGQVLGCFDEMSSFYGQLDLFKHMGSTIDRKTLLTLNGGGSWSRNFKNYSATVEKTAFNITGFIQPAFVHQMLHSSDHDGMNDRQLFDFPPERDVFLDQLKVPMPEDIPDLKAIFCELRDQHRQTKHYSLNDDAYKAFEQAHDNLVRQKMLAQDENVQGVLSKARGYTARLSMVLHCLEQATSRVINDTASQPAWDLEITTQAVNSAAAIIQHLNTQKLIMLSTGEVESFSGATALTNRMVRLLMMESKSADGIIYPSEVAQKHISEKVGQSYPISKAINLMTEAAEMGFGTLETTQTTNNRTVRRFRKRRLSELSDDTTQLLKKSRVTDSGYNCAFGPFPQPSLDS